MSDLVVTVRQISNYPATTAASSGDNLLMQAGGPGAPYISINAADLVATALQGGPAMGLGIAPPDNADGGLFTGTITVPTDGAIAWNAYLNNGDWRLLTPGQAASIGWDQTSGLDFAVSTGGSAQDPITWVSMLRLDNVGNLGLPYGTIGVARDPAANNEVATAGWVGRNTVSTFNNRNGAVQLNAQDVYNALKLCDPIATQPWVQQAITNSIQNLLYTCPFVNTWNGRKGSVYLMLSDISCVFMQPGQQPITQTPPPGSNDDSIANTNWVTSLVAQFDGSAQLSVINVLNHGAKGDGITDDSAAIYNAMVVYAGKAAILLPAPYTFRCSYLFVPSNTHLILNGTLKANDGDNEPVLWFNNVSNIRISGYGTLDGNRANVVANCCGINSSNSSNIQISGITIQNTLLWALNIAASTNVKVDKVTVSGSGASSEFAAGSDNCWLTNCVLDGSYSTDGGFAFYGGVTNSGAIGNVIKNTGASVSYAGLGLYILADSGQPTGCSNITLANNLCYGNGASGIWCDVHTPAVHSGIIITGNRCYGNGLFGGDNADIHVGNANNVTVTGNQSQNYKGPYGIYVTTGSGGAVGGYNVSDNHVLDSAHGGSGGVGMYVDTANYLMASGNYFYTLLGSMTTGLGGTAGLHNAFIGNFIDNSLTDTITYQSDTVLANAVGGQWRSNSSIVPSVPGNTFYLDYAPPHPSVVRIGDRATVAGANNFNLVSDAGSPTYTWAGTVYNNGYLERDATFAAVSDAAGFAIYGAARASDWKNTGGSPQGYGLAGFGVADAPASIANGCYAEARLVDDTSVAYGIETMTINQAGPPPIVNPYHYISGGGFTCGYIASTGEMTGAPVIYDASVGLLVSVNTGAPAAWRRGIVFGATAIAGTNGADSGTGYAIGMARNHAIRWDTSAADVESVRIQSIATGQAQKLIFSDGGVQFQRTDNSAVLWNLAMSGQATLAGNGAGLAIGGQQYPTLSLDKTAGGGNVIQGTVAGSPRWVMRLGDNDAEGAGNTGSSFAIFRYDNTGNFIDEPFLISRNDGTVRVQGPGGLFVSQGAGFHGATPSGTKPTVTGSRGGNAALASLVAALANYGLIADNTTP